MIAIVALFIGQLSFGTVSNCPNFTGNYSYVDDDGSVAEMNVTQTACSQLETSELSFALVIDGQVHTETSSDALIEYVGHWENDLLKIQYDVQSTMGDFSFDESYQMLANHDLVQTINFFGPDGQTYQMVTNFTYLP